MTKFRMKSMNSCIIIANNYKIDLNQLKYEYP